MTARFDRVVLTTNGNSVSLSEGEFFALPLAERLRAVFEKRLEFYAGDVKVETVIALQSIRERKSL